MRPIPVSRGGPSIYVRYSHCREQTIWDCTGNPNKSGVLRISPEFVRETEQDKTITYYPLDAPVRL